MIALAGMKITLTYNFIRLLNILADIICNPRNNIVEKISFEYFFLAQVSLKKCNNHGSLAT